MRDKLIELLDEVHHKPLGKEYPERLETIADHLIANGVTFATDNNVGDKADVTDTNVGKWIPVSERLPDANGVYLSVDDMGIYSFRVFDPNKRMWKAIWEDEKVTHWMPMPEPPKEEVEE